MVDNSRAKTHLENIRNTLNDVEKIDDLKSIITKTSLNLLNNLSDNNLFIDDDIIAWLDSIERDLQNWEIWSRVQTQINTLENERTTLLWWWGWWGGGWGGWGWGSPLSARISEIGNAIAKLRVVADNTWNISRTTTERHDEFLNLLTNARHFNTWNNIPDQNINVATTPITWPDIDLGLFLHTPATAPAPGYLLCDENGNEIGNTRWSYKIQIWWTEYTLWNVDFRGNHLDLRHLTINPRITNTPQTLNLSITARYPTRIGVRTVNVACNKKIKINLTDWSRPLDAPGRRNAYRTLTPPMNDRIQAEYDDNYRENLENEAIRKILREWWNETEVNEIYNNEDRRTLFINRIRTRLNGHFPLLSLANLQTWFETDMTRIDRDVPAQYLSNIASFQNYLRQSIPENLKNYASWQINNNVNIYRNDIFQEFLSFQRDVANSPKDNLDNLVILNSVPNDAQWPHNYPDNRWQRIRWRNSRKNNYTKFFQWRSAELKDQTLKTENWDIKYWVNVAITWVNNIVATINIDGKDEPEIIEAANHDRLIRWILNRANTKDWEPLNRKLRCNIALSVLKAMVMMSPQRLSRATTVTLHDERWNDVDCDRIEADIHWWNLRIRWWRVDVASRTRQNVTIFDEASFKALHNVNTLQEWILQLSTQINNIMNATAQEYQAATNSLRENRWLLKYNTKKRLTWGPIKRLWGRMLYGKTNTNFDFETSVNEAGKTANISFKWWKFTVTWEFDGQEYSYEAKDLWSILRKKINRKRVFDGIELAMVAAINEKYVERLRTNNLIQTENFAISDLNNDKTWRIYIFDEWWNLSYLEIEDRWLNPLRNRNAGRIDPNDIPVERIRCNNQERKEFFQNPLLAWRLLREMRRRLALF